jgi:hypothetical protein
MSCDNTEYKNRSVKPIILEIIKYLSEETSNELKSFNKEPEAIDSWPDSTKEFVLKKSELITNLRRFYDDLWNKAPKVLMTDSWDYLINLLNNMIHLLNDYEKSKIQSILNS